MDLAVFGLGYVGPPLVQHAVSAGPVVVGYDLEDLAARSSLVLDTPGVMRGELL